MDDVAPSEEARASAPARGATRDYSKGPPHLRGALRALGPVLTGLLAAAVVGALLLVLAEFMVINRITIGDNVPRYVFHGHDRHHFALLVIAVLAIPMAWGGFVGGSRPALGVLGLLGLVALLIVLIGDTPQLNDTRNLDIKYEDVRTHVGAGYFIETAGAVLLLFAGAGSWLLTGRAGEPADAEEPGPESAED